MRKNWFVGVVSDAENIIEEGYASLHTKRLFTQFIDTYWSKNITELTTKEEIDAADTLIDYLITDLEKNTLSIIK